MPLEDFLIGAALFGATLAAVAVATAIVVRRRLRHLDPLMLGVLARGTVLAAAALARPSSSGSR